LAFHLSILSFSQIKNQEGNNVVYQNKQEVGKLDEKTNFSCDSCYTKVSLMLFDKPYYFKVPVSVIGIDNQKVFQADYEIIIKKIKKRDAILKYNSRYSSESLTLKIIKKKGSEPIISDIMKTASVSYSYQINKDDNLDVPATLICNKNLNITLDKFELSQYDFSENDKTCFYCPINYNVVECLLLKKKKKTFTWK
jgi:hypothetical protein